MRNVKKLALVGVIAASFLFTSCHSSQQLMEPTLSLKNKTAQPEFLDDISLGANATNIRIAATKGNIAEHKPINLSVTNMLQRKYSELLQVVPTTITNLPLYSFIEDWYGVRYRFGGNDKNGIDCSAFVQRLYENVFCTNLVRTALQQFHMCRFVFNQDSLNEGDLVFFHIHGKRISHVGVYLMNNYFVHASSSQGVMISSLDDAYWSRYYAGAGKIDKEGSF
jgi:lipoprotein Spr